jgi:isopenicillin-N N-acyltransferase like protein
MRLLRARAAGFGMSRLLQESSFRYPLVKAEGSPLELGRQHGEQARLKIAGFFGWMCESFRLRQGEVTRQARTFQPLFEKHCPHLLEEVRGLAEGAGIRFEAALALQLRGELIGRTTEACTTFVLGPQVTASGEVLIGQTSDMDGEMRDFSYLLHLKPEGRPEVIMWTFGGMIGYHGLNEHGVAHFANSLGGGPAWRPGLSHYPLKRLMLEQKNLPAVRAVMNSYPVCSSGNYVLCDGTSEILDVELTAEGPSEIAVDSEGFLTHSNHFLCDPHACEANDAASLPDSFPRFERINTLIGKQSGSLDVASMKSILADHDGHPVSICRHPHEGHGNAMLPNSGRTVAAIIAEPGRGRFHIASGNPCETPFVTYQLSRFPQLNES